MKDIILTTFEHSKDEVMPEVHSRHNRHLGESEEEKLWRGVGVGRPARRLVRGVVDEYVPIENG